MPIFILSDAISFPPPQLADEHGLLAVGGDLSAARLLLAYSKGVFPWFSDPDPILWWSPDPRMVLFPNAVHISRRLAREIRRSSLRITFDTVFETVITDCAVTRETHGPGTWITNAMRTAYCRLHSDGYAHSVEVWDGPHLAGGLYGVSLGRCFFGESMVSHQPNASKIALVALCGCLGAMGFHFIDCQVATDHMARMGAVSLSRRQFLHQLENALDFPTIRGNWSSITPDGVLR